MFAMVGFVRNIDVNVESPGGTASTGPTRMLQLKKLCSENLNVRTLPLRPLQQALFARNSANRRERNMRRQIATAIPVRFLLTGSLAYAAAGIGRCAMVRKYCSPLYDSRRPGNRFSYLVGSARLSAAFAFVDATFSFQSETTLEQ